ncbi:MAG: phosphate ABC transporter ATP-binding protein [Armatimonadia bacterium]|nr:phosphate ABC transporter ATP-binding protein [Armatimonadia bacterium]
MRLRTEELSVFYADVQALKSVTVEIPAREITALIGPSGCGKSTFLRCFNRMNDVIPDARVQGKVLLGDRDVNGRGVDVVELRKRVGMVFQQPNPFPMSIFDNVAYGPKIHGVRGRQQLQEIVETSLKSAALWDEVKDELKKSAFDLSGGQQQRLCIARTLAVKPEVILMDEPCSALDPQSTSRIEDLMTDLKRHYTVIIVTHNMQQAARVSKMTGFFLMGDLVEFDTTEKVFTNPADERTEQYVSGRFG